MPIGAERRIADQYLGPAEERGPAIDPRRHRIGIGEFCGDIVCGAVFRVVERPTRPLARAIGLQTPNDGQAAQRPLPQRGSGLRWSTSGCPSAERGRTSHTILPHSRPLHSKTCRATLLANNQVPSGTCDEARGLCMRTSSRPAQVAQNGSRMIDSK